MYSRTDECSGSRDVSDLWSAQSFFKPEPSAVLSLLGSPGKRLWSKYSSAAPQVHADQGELCPHLLLLLLNVTLWQGQSVSSFCGIWISSAQRMFSQWYGLHLRCNSRWRQQQCSRLKVDMPFVCFDATLESESFRLEKATMINKEVYWFVIPKYSIAFGQATEGLVQVCNAQWAVLVLKSCSGSRAVVSSHCVWPVHYSSLAGHCG